MKCPKCGNEIPDGSLFCENCAAEIRIVPEYETRLEEQISSGMESITRVFSENGQDGDASERENAEKRAGRGRRTVVVFLIGAFSAAAVLLLVYFSLVRDLTRDVSWYVGQAYELAGEGCYLEAAEAVDAAISLSADEEEDGTSDSDLYLLKSDYLLKAGEKDLALGAASDALYTDNVTEEEEIAAYGQLIAIYASYEEYDKIAALLADCSSSFIVDSFPQYAMYDPEFSLEEGEYEDSITLELTDQGQGSIFYTLDGTEPTTSSMLYRDPIVLTEGIYEVSAIFVNHFGLQSEAVTRTYTIVGSVPDAPTVTPNSGTYAKQMTITAQASAAESGSGEEEAAPESALRPTGRIYYTTDGTDPTLSSAEYTGPIAMPEGTTTYRFAVITESGVSSEVVEREYTYKITSSIGEEDGVNYILIALIKRGEIVDTEGTLPGGTAQFTFRYTGLEQIADTGNFLMYTESLVDSAGNAAETGRIYAVNAANGTVNLYSDGVLTPIG